MSADGSDRRRIRVLLADDQALVRAGFRSLLEHSDDIEVVGDAENGMEAVALVQQARPDLVLMDIRMPVLDGIEATRRLQADPRTAACRVVMLTTYEQDDLVIDALRAGASGYLLKSVEPDELRNALRVVAAGEALLSPSVTRRLIDRLAAAPDRRPRDPHRLDVLTEREREVVALVARGMTNDEIGAALFISPSTAKTHVNRAMYKLDARDRAQLVVVAHETGLA